MAERFDTFTERVRRVLTLAQEEAQRFNSPSIGTEHLLLALVREGDGIAARLLNNLGVQLPQVRAAVEQRIERGQTLIAGEFGLSPRAKKVLELAVDEARRLNHRSIGTEHLLLGLVREGEGIAAEVLGDLGVSLEKLRAQVIQVLSQSGAGGSPRRDPTTDPVAPSTGTNFERFTEGARRVLTLAQEEARRFNHNYIGTEHLLLGLTREPDREAARVLAEMGVQLPRVRTAIEFIIGRGEVMAAGEIGLTPRTKKVIELAVDEARQLGDEQVDTGHLLLGLAREGDGIAAGVLASMGVDLGAVRARMLQARAGRGDAVGVVALSDHRLGRSLRAVSANIAGGQQTLTATIGVILRELDLYESGFVAHLGLALVGQWSRPPDFLATAEDDSGGQYRGTRTGGSGRDGPEGFTRRDRYDFTPAIEPSVHELTLTFTMGRRSGDMVVADASSISWTFVVPLAPAAPSPAT